MTRPQDPHRPVFHFGNAFRMISPKSKHLSPELLSLSNDFERTLAERIEKLNPVCKEDILQLSWMRSAMEQLCEIQADVKALIAALELPDDKWSELYFNDSATLLDISNSFISQIHALKQSQFYLVCSLHTLRKSTPEAFFNAGSSLEKWVRQARSKNASVNQCFSLIDGFLRTLDLPKTNHSGKEKVLMRAVYGVKVVTLFVCSVFAATFSGSAEKLIDLKVPNVYSWANAFADLQDTVNSEIKCRKVIKLKEVEAVDEGVKKVYPLIRDGVNSAEALGLVDLTADLRKLAEECSRGLELLLKEVDGFFKVLLSGRDALLGSIMGCLSPSESQQKCVGSPLVK